MRRQICEFACSPLYRSRLLRSNTRWKAPTSVGESLLQYVDIFLISMSVAILAQGSVCASMVGMEQTRERISARERAKTKKREEKLKKKEAKRKQKKGKRWAWSTERAAAEFESSLVAPARLLLAQEHVGRDEFRDPRHFHLVTWGATHIFQ